MADPAPQVFYKDGSPVPHEKLAQAIQSGQAFVEKGADLHMIDDSGAPVKVGADQAQQALASGFQFEHPEATAARQTYRERSTVGQQALTVGEGAARGATLGLSDVALTQALGDDYRKSARERSQVNPISAGVGEVGGAIAGSLATGGVLGAVGAPARGVAAVGRAAEGLTGAGLEALGYDGASALGRMGARAARLGVSGAVEGSLYGAGQAVSKTALDGSELSAEKVLASMGAGAVLGGVTGAGLGALTEGASSALGGLSGDGLRASAREVASESALKAAGAQGSDIRKLVGRRTGEAAAGKIDELGQELLHYEYKTGPREGQRLFSAATKAEDLVDDLAYARQETGEQLGVLKAKIDAAALSNPELAPKVETYLNRVEQEVLKPLRESASPTVQAQAERVEKELSLLQERTAQREALLNAEPQRVRLPDGSIEMRPRVAPPELTFGELDQFRRDLRTVFQPPRPTSGGIPPAVPEHAAHLEKAERILADHLDETAEKSLSAMGQDPAEYKALKQQYSNLKDIEQITNKAALQQLGNRAISPSDYAVGLGSGLGALMTGNIGAMGLGAAASIAHKLVRERGRSVLAVLADHVATIDNGLDNAAKRLSGAVVEAPKRALTPAALGVQEVREAYQHAADAVRNFQQNPDVAGDRMSAPVQHFVGEYPSLASGVQAQIQRANTFLASKLPAASSREGTTFTPEASKPRIPVTEMNKFLRYLRGTTKPQEVIDELDSGKIDREGLEAVKAVSPHTFDELRTRVMTYTAARGKELPFQQRILLSLVFDYPGDKSMDPGYAADIQATFQPQPAAPPETDQGKPVRLNQKLADEMTTPSQSVAQR
jgi:hypothetical protein